MAIALPSTRLEHVEPQNIRVRSFQGRPSLPPIPIDTCRECPSWLRAKIPLVLFPQKGGWILKMFYRVRGTL